MSLLTVIVIVLGEAVHVLGGLGLNGPVPPLSPWGQLWDRWLNRNLPALCSSLMSLRLLWCSTPPFRKEDVIFVARINNLWNQLGSVTGRESLVLSHVLKAHLPQQAYLSIYHNVEEGRGDESVVKKEGKLKWDCRMFSKEQLKFNDSSVLTWFLQTISRQITSALQMSSLTEPFPFASNWDLIALLIYCIFLRGSGLFIGTLTWHRPFSNLQHWTITISLEKQQLTMLARR